MDDIIANGEIAKVGDKGRGLRFPLRRSGSRRDNVGLIGQIVGSKDDQPRIGQHHATGNGRTHNHRSAPIAAQIAGFVVLRLAAQVRIATANAIGDAVLAQNSGQPLHFTLIGNGKQRARLLLGQRAQLLDQRGDRPMQAQRGPRGKICLAQRGCVGIENVHDAKLIQIQSRSGGNARLPLPRRKVQILRRKERVNTTAFVALLHFVPPAFQLVLHHRRLFHKNARFGQQVKDGVARARGRCRKKLPSGKNMRALGCNGFQHGGSLALQPLPAQAHMHVGQHRLC